MTSMAAATKPTMEGSDNINKIPVHDRTSMYLRTLVSPSGKAKSKVGAPHNSHVDIGNSVPQSPIRTDSSRHVMHDFASRINPSHMLHAKHDDDQDEDGDIVHLNHAIIDSYGDKGDYDGGVLRTSLNSLDNGDPIPSASGTMNYADGRIYKGQWKDGQWHGRGRTTYPNGDSYEGEYEGDQRHGIGIYKWNDGRVFQGNFRNDQRNGHGVYRWPDGSTYVGDFQDGKRHGKGTYSFHDGSIYTGEWRRGIRHGTGEYRWVDGRIYKGQWIGGKAHGYGIETRADDSIRHDGKWEEDRPI